MKTISLTVNLTFDKDIADDNMIKEVVGNVLEALVIHREEVGLAPAETDTTTKKIEIIEPFTKTTYESKY